MAERLEEEEEWEGEGEGKVEERFGALAEVGKVGPEGAEVGVEGAEEGVLEDEKVTLRFLSIVRVGETGGDWGKRVGERGVGTW